MSECHKQVTQQQQGTTRLVTPKRIDFTYDLAGERTSITRSADLAGTQVVATTTAQYDPAGRLTEWKHVQRSAGAEINRFTWKQPRNNRGHPPFSRPHNSAQHPIIKYLASISKK